MTNSKCDEYDCCYRLPFIALVAVKFVCIVCGSMSFSQLTTKVESSHYGPECPEIREMQAMCHFNNKFLSENIMETTSNRSILFTSQWENWWGHEIRRKCLHNTLVHISLIDWAFIILYIQLGRVSLFLVWIDFIEFEKLVRINAVNFGLTIATFCGTACLWIMRCVCIELKNT